MKKILKIIGIILLVLAALIALLLIYISTRPSAPNNYTRKVKTGGAGEARYLAAGSHKVSYSEEKAADPYEKYEVWYPSDLKDSDRTWPVVVMLNGTGVKSSKYKAVFKHLASWGFVVIGSEDPSTGNGVSADVLLDYLLGENEDPDSLFYQKIDTENIGLEGHSQGGAGVLSAASITEHKDLYKTVVALSPTHEETAHALEWPYDLEAIRVPTLLLAGTEGEFETELVIPLEAMNAMYDKLTVPKAMMRRIGAEHGQMLYTADGYATAWLMWHLQGDAEAAALFTGPSPEVLSNPLYQDQRIDY